MNDQYPQTPQDDQSRQNQSAQQSEQSQQNQQPTYQQPVNQQPTYQQPIYQQPTYQQPVNQQPMYQQPIYQQPAYQQPVNQQPMYQQSVYNQAPQFQQQRPATARQLFTSRSMLTTILLSFITLGIYGIVMYSHCSEDINTIAERYDGKHTLHWFVMCILAPLTLGILPFVWSHKISNRIGNELTRRGINYKFSASTFWLWNVLGSLIIVGPFVYTHKFFKSLNLLSADYNVKG